nr:MAG TPA: YopX protein [Caudoviricetes sp.]
MIPKYRAWYKEWKEMGRVGEIRFDLDGSVSVVLFKGNYLDVSGPREKIILMQSTGLKDKNGKEIFEGDIVTDGEFARIVQYHQTLGFYMFDEEGNERFFSDSATLEDFGEDAKIVSEILEIIGNVYENPELLEVAE